MLYYNFPLGSLAWLLLTVVVFEKKECRNNTKGYQMKHVAKAVEIVPTQSQELATSTPTREVVLYVTPRTLGIQFDTLKVSLPCYMDMPKQSEDMSEYLEVVKKRDLAFGTIWRWAANAVSKSIRLSVNEERDFIKQAKAAWKQEFNPFSQFSIWAKDSIPDQSGETVAPKVLITVLASEAG